MGTGNKMDNAMDNVRSRTRKNRVKGFTLIEMMIVMAIITALLAMIAPFYFDYLERANETADITNMHSMINAVNRAFLLNEDDHFYDCVWGVSPGHEDNANFGYIYVDNDEVRVSNPAIATLLEKEGFIVKADTPDRLRVNVEPSYYFRQGSRLKCMASRRWCRYQISFRKDDEHDGIWWGVTCANRKTTSSDANGKIRQDEYDPVTTADVALRVGVEPYARKLGGQE